MTSKTHCQNGHEYTAENTYVRPNGSYCCRQCKRDSLRRRYERDFKGGTGMKVNARRRDALTR